MKALEALAYQTWPLEAFEVIVVADACQDDTQERVTAYAAQAPYPLALLQHNAGSAAATRNLGAATARGETLLFMDDDIIAGPELIRRHHEAQSLAGIVLGYSKPILPARSGWWQYHARRWWEDQFKAMRQLGHRFTYKDFFSGNVSMPVTLFHKIGGFDVSFTGAGYEDYELGLRLLKAGARFRFAPQAIGYHHDDADFQRWLHRIRQEGIGTVQIGRRHPELRPSLYITARGGNRRRRLRSLAFKQPQLGDRIEQLFIRQAGLYERFRLRRQWWKLIRSLREYNYWRGVATVMKQHELNLWLQETPVSLSVSDDAPAVDITNLPPSLILQDSLQQGTTTGLRLTAGGIDILTIPPQPGAEPLQEAHLQRALSDLARTQFVPALALPVVRSIIDRGSRMAGQSGEKFINV
jgi:GT2 family glycosyltransferase